MKRFNALVGCLIITLLFFACYSSAGEKEVIQSILDARASVKTFPLPSAQIADLSVEKAYGLQRDLAKRIIE